MNKKDREYIKNFDGILERIDAQNKLIDELIKKVNEKSSQSWVDGVWNDLNTLKNKFYDFKNKIENSPKTAIVNCKKCGHATIHLVEINNYQGLTMTICLTCGLIWETTTKNITEVKEIKKK